MYVGDALVGSMSVGVDAIEEADLATSKYAMFLDDSMNDALGVVMDDVKEESCQVSCHI